MYNRRSFLQYIVPILSGSLLAPTSCITNGLKKDGDTYRKDAVSKMKQKQGLKKSHKPLYGHNNVGFVGHHSTTSPVDLMLYDQSEKKNNLGQDDAMFSKGDIKQEALQQKSTQKKMVNCMNNGLKKITNGAKTIFKRFVRRGTSNRIGTSKRLNRRESIRRIKRLNRGESIGRIERLNRGESIRRIKRLNRGEINQSQSICNKGTT